MSNVRVKCYKGYQLVCREIAEDTTIFLQSPVVDQMCEGSCKTGLLAKLRGVEDTLSRHEGSLLLIGNPLLLYWNGHPDFKELDIKDFKLDINTRLYVGKEEIEQVLPSNEIYEALLGAYTLSDIAKLFQIITPPQDADSPSHEEIEGALATLREIVEHT